MKRLSMWTVVAALCALPVLVHAQAVRGTVVGPADDAGIAGVVVLLVDGEGRVVSRALTNTRGEYRVAAGTAGVYRLRTLRIGFRPATSDPLQLREGQELTQRLALGSVAFVLDTVRVVDANACRVRVDTSATTFAIWEQVRTALTATQISAGDRSLAATVVTYDRTLDAEGRRVRTQSSRLTRSLSRAWSARSADELHRAGYIVDDADGGKSYYAPDIDVLLSDGFLDDHCFRIAKDRDPRRIGLEFEPSRNRRDLPDIHGTIWLNRRTSELDRLEFRYVNVSRAQEDGGAGGEEAFVRMANGGWAISRWSIRMPVLEVRSIGGFDPGHRTNEERVAEIKISGGELGLMVHGKDTLWARAPLVLTGSLNDSLSGRAVQDARVSLVGTTSKAVSDRDGRFSIAGVLPGEYSLEVRTASLDAVGAVHQTAVTFTDGAEPLRIRVPVAQQVAATLCGPRRESQDGIVLGTLSVRGESVPPRNVRVSAEWTDISYDAAPAAGKPNRTIEARADTAGTFRLCGVPRDKALVLRVVSDSLAAEPLPVRITEGLLARADIVADRVAVTGVVFSGVVLADSTRQPITNVEVSLADLALTQTTNERGVFRFANVPSGTHTVTARRVGYGPLDAKVTFGRNEPVTRQLFLSRVSTLDSVNVIAARTKPGIGLAAFEERRRLGTGKFMDSEFLAKNSDHRMYDLLRGISGVKILTGRDCGGMEKGCKFVPPTGRFAASSRHPQINPCFMEIWLDGVVVGRGASAGSGSDWEAAFDLNTLDVGRLQAVEVYRSESEVPVAYGGSSSQCGTVLLWMRRQ